MLKLALMNAVLRVNSKPHDIFLKNEVKGHTTIPLSQGMAFTASIFSVFSASQVPLFVQLCLPKTSSLAIEIRV